MILNPNDRTARRPMVDRPPASAGVRPVPDVPVLTERRWIPVLWSVSLISWLALLLFPEQLAPLAQENGVIEWAGTLAFGVASLVLAKAAGEATRTANRIMAGFLALLFFVCFMEELSWGQQVFRWETPSAFDGNLQNETNLHNFYFGFDQQRIFTLGILGLAVGVPLAARWRLTSGLIHRLGIPVVPLSVAAWVVATVVVANVAERAMDWNAQRGLREFMEASWGAVAAIVAICALEQGRTAVERSARKSDS